MNQTKAGRVEAFVRENKGLPNLTLAKLLVKKNPLDFNSLESARAEVRRIRGALGNKNRNFARQDLVRTSEQSDQCRSNPYGLPESISDDWKIIPFPVENGSGLILCDMHYPFQDNAAITLALDWGKKNNYTDFVLLNGDIGDFHTISRFEKEPSAMTYRMELDGIKKFLEILRKQFPKAKIIYKEGNHEKRLPRFLALKALELFDLKDFMFEKYLGLQEMGVEYYKYDDVFKVGKLFIGHGDEMGSVTSAVNPARGLFLKTFECAIIGHLHKTSQHTETSIADKLVTTWSIGCLSNLHPKWLRFNKWNHGCAGLKISGKDFEVENKRIFTKEGMVR